MRSCIENWEGRGASSCGCGCTILKRRCFAVIAIHRFTYCRPLGCFALLTLKRQASCFQSSPTSDMRHAYFATDVKCILVMQLKKPRRLAPSEWNTFDALYHVYGLTTACRLCHRHRHIAFITRSRRSISGSNTPADLPQTQRLHHDFTRRIVSTAHRQRTTPADPSQAQRLHHALHPPNRQRHAAAASWQAAPRLQPRRREVRHLVVQHVLFRLRISHLTLAGYVCSSIDAVVCCCRALPPSRGEQRCMVLQAFPVMWTGWQATMHRQSQPHRYNLPRRSHRQCLSCQYSHGVDAVQAFIVGVLREHQQAARHQRHRQLLPAICMHRTHKMSHDGGRGPQCAQASAGSRRLD